MKISVFGNPDLKEDNAGIKLIPWLKQKYPEAEIKIEDPVESLKPVDDWIIVDACAGINKITEFEDLDKFEAARRVSVHDYEVAMELKLLKKLGKIKKLKIIAVPMPPLNSWQIIPVPPPTAPSCTGPLSAWSSASRTCAVLTCWPQISFSRPS